MDVKNELLDIIFHDRPASHHISGIEQKIHAYAKKPVMTVRPDLINSLINPPVALGVSLISAMLIVLGRLFDTLTVITLIACIPTILILAAMTIRAREIRHTAAQGGCQIRNTLQKTGFNTVRKGGSHQPQPGKP